MEWQFNDGGRSAAGAKGFTGDCGTRAVAIAAQLPYRQVYDRFNRFGANERQKRRGKTNARTGVFRSAMHRYMAELGWNWTPTMQIGSGCKVHMRAEELPNGRLVVSLSKHYAAVIDGVLHDTYDCSRGGTRCVYGYWSQ